jgi:carbon-monoxide dehydrogenase medium subunit
VKPAPFSYVAPSTLADALAVVNDGTHAEPRPLAGGQSLVPLLNMRFSRPTLLVDLNGIDDLRGLDWADGHVRIRAMTRQRVLETDPRVRARLPLLTEAAGLIAHVAIRTRGTIGGSLAHADPAAELPAAMLALGATLLVRTVDGGTRAVPAADFFLGPFTTAVAHGELLEGVEVPIPEAGTGFAFVEMSRVHGAFAIAGVAALVALGPGGLVTRASLALCGVGGAPYAPAWADELMVGRRLDAATIGEAGERVSTEVDPPTDGQASSDYRRRLAGVLTRRALVSAFERAEATEAA